MPAAIGFRNAGLALALACFAGCTSSPDPGPPGGLEADSFEGKRFSFVKQIESPDGESVRVEGLVELPDRLRLDYPGPDRRTVLFSEESGVFGVGGWAELRGTDPLLTLTDLMMIYRSGVEWVDGHPAYVEDFEGMELSIDYVEIADDSLRLPSTIEFRRAGEEIFTEQYTWSEVPELPTARWPVDAFDRAAIEASFAPDAQEVQEVVDD